MNNLSPKKAITRLALFALFFSISMLGFIPGAKADYTVAAGSTIYANTITAQSGILTINGTLYLDRNVSLLNFTSVVINGPNGQIYWNGNYDLKFSAGIDFDINNPSLGLQPTAGNGNASTKLTIGTTTIAVSSDNSNNAAYSFEQFNTGGGLPKFTFSASSQFICYGTPITATITPLDNIVPFDCFWSVNNGGTISPASASNFNTAQTATITPTNTTGAKSYIISCIVKRAADSDPIFTRTVTVTVNAAGVWVGGGANQNWNTTANWCGGTVPTSATNVVINNGASSYPIITGTALANNITIATGGIPLPLVTVSTGGTLKIAGAITSTNGINATAGTIELIGATQQTISGNNFVSNTIANLTSTNAAGVAISSTGGMLNLSSAVSFGNVNSATITTNDNLTLLSSASATARIADVTNNAANTGNNISGKVIIERYIPGKRAWRLLSAPVTKTSNATISASWQEGGRTATVSSVSNPNPGYGTHITFGNPATNGYDQGVNGNTSIRYLINTGWNGVPTGTNNASTLNAGNIADQPGYFLFLRGDRSTVLSSGTTAAVSPTILRVKGNLNVGQTDVALGTTYTVGSSNWRVISNPYPSAINFKKIVTNSANTSAAFPNSFYIWDPNITGSNGVGGWVGLSYNPTTLLYDKTIAGSTISTSGDIQSGTAFVIDYNGSATKMTMLESNKSTSSNIQQFRPARQNQQLRISLLAKNADNSVSLNDGALVIFDSAYSNKNDGLDMNKMPNFAENFAVLNKGEMLALNKRQTINKTDTIAFRMSQMKQKSYQLELVMNNIAVPAGTAGFLEDLFLNTKSPVNFKDTTKYDFSITSNSLSAATDRFRLIFKPSVTYVAVKGDLAENDIKVDWKITDELNINRYEIERADENNVFSTIGILKSNGNNPGAVDYRWVDANPASGNYFYRIKSISNNGVVAYSKLVNIKVFNRTKAIAVINNPVNTNTIKLQINDSKAGLYNVRLLNSGGQAITASTVRYVGGSATVSIESSQNLLSGSYQLQITSPDNKSTSLKVIVQK